MGFFVREPKKGSEWLIWVGKKKVLWRKSRNWCKNQVSGQEIRELSEQKRQEERKSRKEQANHQIEEKQEESTNGYDSWKSRKKIYWVNSLKETNIIMIHCDCLIIRSLLPWIHLSVSSRALQVCSCRFHLHHQPNTYHSLYVQSVFYLHLPSIYHTSPCEWWTCAWVLDTWYLLSRTANLFCVGTLTSARGRKRFLVLLHRSLVFPKAGLHTSCSGRSASWSCKRHRQL